jgi:WD40 repeat protein
MTAAGTTRHTVVTMTQVFISYSRKDGGFVQSLQRALEEVKRKTWVDWEDIPPSAEWLKRICSAIDEADTFVFLLSPDSVSSATCRIEIDHASSRRTKIIPGIDAARSRDQRNRNLSTINHVVFSPCGRYLASGASDGTARVWALPAGNEIVRIPEDMGGHVAFSPDGQLVASVNNGSPWHIEVRALPLPPCGRSTLAWTVVQPGSAPPPAD